MSQVFYCDWVKWGSIIYKINWEENNIFDISYIKYYLKEFNIVIIFMIIVIIC